MTTLATVQPLAGVRVLDLTRLLPGNYCTWLLASLGADVVKIEDPGAGDYQRAFSTQVEGQGAAHHQVNRTKRSVVVDLKNPEGVQLLRELARTADVLVESFRPGTMAKFGLGPAELRAVAPQLVYVSLSGYGATGPLVRTAGHDLNYLGLSGLLDRLGHADRAPITPPLPLADIIGGSLVPAIGALAMLYAARQSGVGGHLDAAMTDAVALLPNMVVAELLAGVTQPGPGATEFGGGKACYRVYALADGHVAVGALEPAFWRALCQALGTDDLVDIQDDPGRQDEIAHRLTEIFAAMTRAQFEKTFNGVDACTSIVGSYEELLASDYVRERGLVRTDPELPMPVLAAPFVIDGQRPPERGRAPFQGEHTGAALRDWGMSAERIDALLAAGAIRQGGAR